MVFNINYKVTACSFPRRPAACSWDPVSMLAKWTYLIGEDPLGPPLKKSLYIPSVLPLELDEYTSW